MRLPRTGSAPLRAGWPLFSKRGGIGAALVLIAVVLSLGLTFGLRGFAGGPTTPSDELGDLIARSGQPLVVYSEFDEETDAFWAANPADPSDRIQLGSSRHAPGYGVTPALAPDGARIAYAALAPEVDPLTLHTSADLWMLDVASGNAKALASGIDVIVPPVWTPAGDAVAVRRGEWYDGGGADFAIALVDVDGNETPLVAAAADLFPIDFSPDGVWLYYAALTANGTMLERVAISGGTPETLALLSDGIARDWQLSPNGTQLAYLAQAADDAQDPFDLRVLHIATGEASAPVEDSVATFNPLWEEDGRLTVGLFDNGGVPVRFDLNVGRSASAAPLASATDGRPGFDVPLSWSPDGGSLALRTFEDASTTEAGASYVEVLDANGERHRLSDRSDVIVAGWLEALP